MIAKNLVDPPKISKKTFLDTIGFYKCERCKSCRTTADKKKEKQLFVGSNGKEYRIDKFISCNTRYVVYFLVCPCGLVYVGRTTRCLYKRINEHVTNIKNGFRKHSVSNHFRTHHQQNPALLKFYGIDKVLPHWRGGDMRTSVSQAETRWIFELGCLVPAGLNIEIYLNCFFF